VTLADLLAAAHRKGEGRLQQYCDHLAMNGWYSDPETFATDKLPGGRTKKVAFEKIEERLREFMTLPLFGNHHAPLLNDPENATSFVVCLQVFFRALPWPPRMSRRLQPTTGRKTSS
jgi:hypothetical protein